MGILVSMFSCCRITMIPTKVSILKKDTPIGPKCPHGSTGDVNKNLHRAKAIAFFSQRCYAPTEDEIARYDDAKLHLQTASHQKSVRLDLFAYRIPHELTVDLET